jgi:hypothetical protein
MLKAALRHYTFDVTNFVGSDGKPNWAGLSSHVYDEIVVIDSRSEQPMAYAVELIEDVTLEELLAEEEERRSHQD